MMSASTLLDSSFNVTADVLLQQLTQETKLSDYAVLAFSLIGLVSYLTNGRLWNKQDPYHYKWFERPQQTLTKDVLANETRNVSQKLQESGKDFVIFWGSQSGTAEGFANRLARECHRRYKVDALVADLSDYDADTIAWIPNTKFAIFIMSTYGEGDPSDNASDFWEWIRANSLSLRNLKYAAFGLGNTNYKYYNKVIDVVVEKLDSCGASSMLPVGKADDSNNGTEEDFLDWKERLFNMFKVNLGLAEQEREYEPSIKVVEDTSLELIDLHAGEPVASDACRKAASQCSAIAVLPIMQIRELTMRKSNNRNCLHIELDLSGHAQLKYKTGDHLSVYPTNSSVEVKRLLHVLGLEDKKDVPLLISSSDPSNAKLRIPSPTNLSALFTSYLEISAPVSRETVQTLIPFAPSESIASVLRTVSSDKTAYANFLSSNHITLARLLEYTLKHDPTSQWSHLPLSFVLEAVQPTSPRHYSISSSSAVSPRRVSITVANAPTPLPSNPSITIPGLTTSYLSALSFNADMSGSDLSLYASIRRSTFKLPVSSKAPIILIGAGTGIAPLRAFVQERAALADIGREIGQISFFYGCRRPDQDYLYREEIEKLSRTSLRGKMQVITAFSRPDDPAEKRYVQDRISEQSHAENVATMMVDHDAAIFFCGSTNMAKAAGDAVMAAVGAKNGFSTDDVLAWRDERRRVGRWKEDVWG